MKTANDFSCSWFKKNIQGFVDDEIDAEERRTFLDHASRCGHCFESLNCCRNIKKTLGRMSKVEVSPDFDFRLKARITREDILLKDPFYRFRLSFSNYFKPFVIPTASLIIISGLFYSGMTLYRNGNPGSLLSFKKEIKNEIKLEEKYVLESVNKNDLLKGVFLKKQTSTQSGNESTNNNQQITMVNF